MAARAQSSQGVRWHCPRRSDYLLQMWPDGAVVYDEASGDLHALSAVAGQLLQLILMTQQSCAHSLAETLLGEPPDPADVCRVDEWLREFESLGLIEPCGA